MVYQRRGVFRTHSNIKDGIFGKIFNGFQSSIIFAWSSILHVWLGCESASAMLRTKRSGRVSRKSILKSNRCSSEKLFWEISQNSLGNTCGKHGFTKKYYIADGFRENSWHFSEQICYRHLRKRPRKISLREIYHKVTSFVVTDIILSIKLL